MGINQSSDPCCTFISIHAVLHSGLLSLKADCFWSGAYISIAIKKIKKNKLFAISQILDRIPK